ncbi:MAG: hypothetical protein DI598_02050 [Pseudopedobacter saltans]|uniref:Glycoside hydrolase 97 n=1 Tax=Pseudopedobacter saltans TaxID=151895 RepID=A0A2W5FAE5_9SPHI|nr:MAG: hypothetical protein DI598_02050 [Pseudopedobacter saltans]
MRKQVLLLLVFQSLLRCSFAQSSVSMESPDKKTDVKIFLNKGVLTYSLKYDNAAICSGEYGFQLENLSYGSNATKLVSSKANLTKRTFDIRGNQNTATTIKNEYRIDISNEGNTTFSVFANVYNDGIAFSYEVNTEGKSIEKNLSNIKLSKQAICWFQDDVIDYEGNYYKSTVEQLKDKQKIGMPLTVSFPSGIYASFMEAKLDNFSGSYFVFNQEKENLEQVLAGSVQTNNSTLQSPWLIITLGKDLNDLVNNYIMDDVSPYPDKTLYPKGFQTDWIKPGMALWSWMSNDRTVSPENMKRFTDYAAQLHIPYNLIDEGWSYWKSDGKDCWDLLKDQVKYANSKGVGIWVWKAYPDRGHVPGLKDSSALETFMQKCAGIGVKGLKIDFFDSEKQPEMAFFARAAKIAAKYHLMIDYHGANKGSGFEHTYPNVLTQEGVRGLEQEYNVNWPFHNTVLPFTRYLSGPADYTPMSFRPFVYSTTLAQQAASVAVYTSPFLCLGVDPTDLLKSPSLPFIQNIPSTWDETIVLKESKIGEIAAFARRKGNKWYLAILNGETPNSLDINLSFLGKNQNYKLDEMKNDLKTRTTHYSTQNKITSSGRLKIELPYGGGYLGIFSK